MFTGLSSCSRVSHQCAMSSPWRLVLESARRQPTLPVQATRPARIAVALVERPSVAIAASIVPTRSVGMPEISRFCHTVSRMSPSPKSRAMAASPRICSPVSLPTGSTTPIQFKSGCFCGCMPTWAVRPKAGRGAMASAGARTSLPPSFSSLALRHSPMPPASITYLRRALARLVRSPWSIKTHGCVGDLCRLGGLHHHAGPVRKGLVSGDPAEEQPEPDACLHTEAILHLDGLKPDVVGIFDHRDDAGAVEADVELARNAVERAIVEDVEVPFARIRSRVDQLLRVDAGGRRPGDVADVVGAGPARTQAQILNRLDDGDRILGLDLAHLQIGAGRHVRIAAGVSLREVADACELPVLEDAVGDAQAAHICRLVRCAVEQAVEAPAEIVVGFRRLVVCSPRFQALIAIERVQFALELLRIGKLLAFFDEAILCAQMSNVDSHGLGRGRAVTAVT